ncbi:hypothetical protein ACP4OV_022021 [Aristida adscensionis]
MASARALLGLAAASTATAMAMSDPPEGFDKTSYLLAVSGVFFAGVNLVAASVSATNGAGRNLLHAAALAVVVAAAAGLALASLLM